MPRDATDRRRFEALTDPARALPDGAKIRIDPDKATRQLTISDDGAGMTRDEMVQNLGTIARSGTRAFGQAIHAGQPEGAEKQGRPAEPDRAVRRRLLRRLHGGGPCRGDLAPRR